jgi:hypothetical protein
LCSYAKTNPASCRYGKIFRGFLFGSQQAEAFGRGIKGTGYFFHVAIAGGCVIDPCHRLKQSEASS